MVSLKEVLFLLWIASCAKALCSNATICITNGDEGESQCQQNHQIFQTLSDLTINKTSCETVHIYLTSGTHILNRNLDFSSSVQATAICGASQGPPSIIECQGETGIAFNEETIVKMELVVLLHCNRTRNMQQTLQAALFFKNAQYILSGVTLKNTEGWGVYAENCSEQIIIDCTFINNKGNIAIRGTAPVVLIEINNTKIHDGKQSGLSIADCSGVDVHLRNIFYFTFRIINSDLQRNQGGHLRLCMHNDIMFTYNDFTIILIDNSTFNLSDDSGVGMRFICNEYNIIDINVTLQRSSFSKNIKSLFLTDATHLIIEDCIFDNNRQNSLEIENVHNDDRLLIKISNTAFINNSRAIVLFTFWLNSIDVKINECVFTNHTENGVVAMSSKHITGSVTIEKSSFQGNRKLNGNKDCSVLSIDSLRNITLSDVNIIDNSCTGIKIMQSTVKMYNLVTLSGNRGQNGGGLSLSMSKLIFSTSSKLNIINNSADAYGGGMYLEEETCSYVNTCFFQLEEEYPSNSSEVIAFSGNRAKRGGDQMLGGCLSNCSIQFNKKKTFLSMCDLNKDFISSANTLSQSSFVGYQRKVAFCKNASPSHFQCSFSNSMHIYRGQIFNVPLMIADDCCFPSVEYIEAKITIGSNEKSPLQFKQNNPILKSRKTCYEYTYALKGGFGLKKPATIEFSIPQQLDTAPATLTVYLEECPNVYEEDTESGECVCHEILESHKVKCTPSNKSLHIPSQTWLGELWNESESIAVQNNCKYCKSEEMDLIIPIDSNELCLSNRTGIMCGACVSDYSLLLGGYECADCSGSTYKGVLLFLAFIAIGIVLVILLLGLDLTVSTGMVNGPIFYSNIVYLNSDTMLPILRGENSTHLLNTVRILSTFQAWMNLDFGISTCFFLWLQHLY